MEKGDVPIPYIIALILGIAIVAILAYWFFSTGGKFTNTISQADCSARQMQWCAQWKAAGSPAPSKTGTIKPFSEPCPASGTYANDCCSFWLGESVTESSCA